MAGLVKQKFKDDSPLVLIFKEIYYILIALAIGNGLLVFVSKTPGTQIDSWLMFFTSIVSFNFKVFQSLHLAPGWLFPAFIITIIRFSLGGIVALEQHKKEGCNERSIKKRDKCYYYFLLDLHFNLITMMLFLLLSNSLNATKEFVTFFWVLLIWDTLWIIRVEAPGANNWIQRIKDLRFWLYANLIIATSLLTSIPLLIFLACFIAVFLDYDKCREVYCGLLGFYVKKDSFPSFTNPSSTSTP